jgi:hypothetical protein
MEKEVGNWKYRNVRNQQVITGIYGETYLDSDKRRLKKLGFILSKVS